MLSRNFYDIFKHISEFYKFLLILGSALLLTYFFPDQNKFPYHYNSGKPWIYHDLYAPFNFPVLASKTEIKKIKDSVIANAPVIVTPVSVDTSRIFRKIFLDLTQNDSLHSLDTQSKHRLKQFLTKIYRQGLTDITDTSAANKKILIKQGKTLSPAKDTYTISRIKRELKNIFPSTGTRQQILEILFQRLKPSLITDSGYTEKYKQNLLSQINPHTKIIYKNELIVRKGERIGPEQMRILDSLKKIYGKDTRNHLIVSAGYFFLAVFVLLMVILYFKSYKRNIFLDNSQLTLIFFNILLIGVTFFSVQHYFPSYIYVVPFVVLPIIIKSFFDREVSLVTLGASIIIIAPGMSFPFEFAYIEALAGFASIILISDLTSRSRIFKSLGAIILIYILAYVSYYFIFYGNWKVQEQYYFILFVINGLLAGALVHELILLFEKLFKIPSDVAYLELMNTSNKLLKQLAEKAPGTFQHSLQVGNLAEAIAKEINANPLLVRVAALYHDIGKMKNPKYFTENQLSDVNPHENLPPEESAKIIINHVIDGIEIARKNNIPERIIDFIRTHHGNGLVKYFYTKAKQMGLNPNPEDYRYPGPNPFSKETAILMMADSVEAASKSLKNPDIKQLDELVENIINGQLQDGLLMNADITLKEINKAKKVLKNKLRSIYHLRVSYPK